MLGTQPKMTFPVSSNSCSTGELKMQLECSMTRATMGALGNQDKSTKPDWGQGRVKVGSNLKSGRIQPGDWMEGGRETEGEIHVQKSRCE